jgi:RNA polymerase sigma-70 factor (ECF subfamily)
MNSNKTLHPSVMAQAVKTVSDGTKEREKLFWQQWGQHRDYLYHCCLKWMRGNAIDAEEVLSQAMLKAIEKIRQGSHIVTNFKAWLTRTSVWIYIENTRC